jgi:lipopolysaccharide transport system ATP-binding protein
LASLLEVGTGFHPELTGRENIYLNGSILGLKKMRSINNLILLLILAALRNFWIRL